MEITLLNRQRARPVDRIRLERFLDRLVQAMPPDRSNRLAVCLVSDRRMRELNRRFRDRDATTDVLSFPSGAPDPDGGHHLGDIVVSVQRADAQARERGHDLSRELRILLIHGYLHLLGYDHELDGGRMLRLQRRLVRRLVDAGRESGPS